MCTLGKRVCESTGGSNPPLSARLKNAQPWFHNKRALRVFLFLGGLKQTFVCCVFHTRTAFSAVTLEQYFLMAFSVKSPLAIDASLPLATNPPLSARLKNAQPWFHNKRALRVFLFLGGLKQTFVCCVFHTRTAFSAVTLEQYFLMAFSVKSPLAIDASLPLATNPPLSARLKNAQPWFHNKRALRVFLF